MKVKRFPLSMNRTEISSTLLYHLEMTLAISRLLSLQKKRIYVGGNIGILAIFIRLTKNPE